MLRSFNLLPLLQIVEFTTRVALMNENADGGEGKGGPSERRPRRQHRHRVPPPARGEAGVTRTLSKTSIDWDFDSPPWAPSPAPASMTSPPATTKRNPRGSRNGRSRQVGQMEGKQMRMSKLASWVDLNQQRQAHDES